MNPVEMDDAMAIRAAVDMEAPGYQRADFGRDQVEYGTLPGIVLDSPTQPVVTRWTPTHEERALLRRGGVVELTMFTFGAPLQPVMLMVREPSPAEAAAEDAEERRLISELPF